MRGRGRGHRRKALTDDCLQLTAAAFRRAGVFRPGGPVCGSITWSFSGGAGTREVRFAVESPSGVPSSVRLAYPLTGGREADYRVGLASTPCRFGGLRRWLACPLAADGVACGLRCGVLYLRGDYFGCRRCHRLTYPSTRGSDRRVEAFVRSTGPYAVPRGWSYAGLGFKLRVVERHMRVLDRVWWRVAEPGEAPPGWPLYRLRPGPPRVTVSSTGPAE